LWPRFHLNSQCSHHLHDFFEIIKIFLLRMLILVTYYSVRGSTKEIAERIGSVLSTNIAAPSTVEVLPMEQVVDLSKYSFVIIGSPVHGFVWVEYASSWLSVNSAALSNSAVWAFSVGTPFAVGKIAQRMMESKDEEKNLAAAISKDVKLEGHVLFNGRFLKSHASSKFNFWWRVFGGKFGDFREWEKIDKWTGEIGHTIVQRIGDAV
jgi:menaquinone-dependent protoporphyrinogen oxidase